jgi:predicted  nucleic acid-binding Zn-ribbon protein
MMEMSTIKRDIADKQAQASSLSVFRAGMKHAINSNVGELTSKTKELKISLSDLDEKMRIVENIIMPIKKSVEEYSSNLNRISDQFLISKRRKK